MSTAPPGPGKTWVPDAPVPPNCRHCDVSLPMIGLFAYTVGGYIILNLYCPACRKDLHFQIYQKQQPEGEPPRVQIPS
jgi:hypothetical protein